MATFCKVRCFPGRSFLADSEADSKGEEVGCHGEDTKSSSMFDNLSVLISEYIHHTYELAWSLSHGSILFYI